MKAIQSARRRGRLGAWRRRLLIILFTAIAVGASYLFSADKPDSYQDLLAGVVAFVGLSALVLDWWITRGIKRSGGVQALRSGGILSTGPAATAGRLWAQGEGFRICGLPDDARKNFSEAASLSREAKQEALEATVKLSRESWPPRPASSTTPAGSTRRRWRASGQPTTRAAPPAPSPRRGIWRCFAEPTSRPARPSRRPASCSRARTTGSAKAARFWA